MTCVFGCKYCICVDKKPTPKPTVSTCSKKLQLNQEYWLISDLTFDYINKHIFPNSLLLYAVLSPLFETIISSEWINKPKPW